MTPADSCSVNQFESVSSQVIEKNHVPALENRASLFAMKNHFWLICMAAALAMATLAPVMVLAA
jgi:hypothetical protein